MVGLAWGAWHAPTVMGDWSPFPVFVASVVLASLLIGWLWERSGRSVLACVAAHTGLNLGIVHAPALPSMVVFALAATWVGVSHLRGRHRAAGGRTRTYGVNLRNGES